MIIFIEDAPNIAVKAEVQPVIEEYFTEVRKLLPELPEQMKIWLDNDYLIPETGEGGFAYAPDIMNISFDKDFKDKALQCQSLRGTIFHEGYHLVQGHTSEGTTARYISALDSAIYEGCGTVFEREYGGVSPLWGEYAQHSLKKLEEWKVALSAVSHEQYAHNRDTWVRWAFYDEESGERWRVYKTGTWLVDEALKATGLDILDIRTKSAAEIIDLL